MLWIGVQGVVPNASRFREGDFQEVNGYEDSDLKPLVDSQLNGLLEGGGT